jgi:hypothetical protein
MIISSHGEPYGFNTQLIAHKYLRAEEPETLRPRDLRSSSVIHDGLNSPLSGKNLRSPNTRAEEI